MAALYSIQQARKIKGSLPCNFEMMEDVFEQARKGDLFISRPISLQKTSCNMSAASMKTNGRFFTTLSRAANRNWWSTSCGKVPLKTSTHKTKKYNTRRYAAPFSETVLQGWTPLHSAVSCGFERVAELLILHGADVTCQTSAKRTPLHYAVAAAAFRLSTECFV